MRQGKAWDVSFSCDESSFPILTYTHSPSYHITAWSVNYEACYCNFVDTVKVCKEPCVDEEYIDFSTVPFTTFDYCEESVCAKDWHHSQEYCDDTVKFDADECAATIEKLMPPAKKVEDIYTYSQTAMGGWLSWPKDKNDSTFRSFTADDGVTNVDECAAMCDKLGTSTGAWSTKYSACWCSFVEVSKLCKEPCVEEEYTEFSNVAFTTFDYCSESVCAKDWHHSQEYCNDEIKFDAAVCAATIQDLTTSSLSSKPIKEALTDYYAYTQDVKGGWLSWPQETNTDNFQSFKSTDGVTNPLECAAKCHELDAPTGGKYNKDYKLLLFNFHLINCSYLTSFFFSPSSIVIPNRLECNLPGMFLQLCRHYQAM